MMHADTPAHEMRVIHLYDEYLNIYADRGNIDVLRRRCEWRGIGMTVDGLGIDDSFDAAAYDLIYIGGGQDRDQQMIAERMAGSVGEAVRTAVAGGTALLAVCGGYQLLGHGYLDTTGTMQPGVGLFDLRTEAGDTRMIGNVAIECTLPAAGSLEEQTLTVVGFENHAGRTRLAEGAEPWGRVLFGHGNDGASGFEGCRTGHAIGTYLHGPLLPRNPQLADWLIAAALEHRYGADAVPALEPLDDRFADRARAVALGRAREERRERVR